MVSLENSHVIFLFVEQSTTFYFHNESNLNCTLISFHLYSYFFTFNSTSTRKLYHFSSSLSIGFCDLKFPTLVSSVIDFSILNWLKQLLYLYFLSIISTWLFPIYNKTILYQWIHHHHRRHHHHRWQIFI